MSESKAQTLLDEFFDRPVAQKATAPLKRGIEIALRIKDGGTFTLTKKDKTLVEPRTPTKPDMTFDIPLASLESLCAESTEDIGEIGVAILKLMANSDPALRVTAKVHIGAFDLFRHGYLGVLPLGGSTVMKFLASKGLTGIGKIKEGISKLKD
jgi:hypothetical protein